MCKTIIYAGIDSGACSTKCVLLDQQARLRAYTLEQHAMHWSPSARRCLEQALAHAQLPLTAVTRIVATGYGRTTIEWAHTTRTEIACHAHRAYTHFRRPLIVVDIGSQDNKIIHLDQQGNILSFQMNRKCAAGTGAFLEEMALHLTVPLARMAQLAWEADQAITLNSFCTVFAKTEILSLRRRGVPLANIIRGVYAAIVQRIIAMDPLQGQVVMTGGVVAHHPILVHLLQTQLPTSVLLPPYPQLAGAWGAALLALQI